MIKSALKNAVFPSLSPLFFLKFFVATTVNTTDGHIMLMQLLLAGYTYKLNVDGDGGGCDASGDRGRGGRGYILDQMNTFI